MSIVTLQLGQCGNQVGHCLFSTLHADVLEGDCRRGSPTDDWYARQSLTSFFDCGDEGAGPAKARAVLCDTEEKVVAMVTQAAAKSGRWTYADSASLCLKRGSGNNWALGHSGHGPRCWPSLLEAVRRQAEACDRLDGFVALLSTAGGTGSGLGTFVCERMREEFGDAQLLAGLVWPHSRGEVSVQSYNCVLTAAHLAGACDALLLFENEELQAACERRLGLPRVNVGHLNELIAQQLTSCLQPTSHPSRTSSSPLGDILLSLCPHPDLRLLRARAIPFMSQSVKQFSTYAWPGLLRHMRQMLLANASMEEGVDWSVGAGDSRQRCAAIRLCLRGPGATQPPQAELSAFQHDSLHCGWVPREQRLECRTVERPCCGYERSCSMLVNSSSAADSLDNAVAKAWRMFSSKAFLHQYAKFGLEEAAFLDCFAACEQLVHNYRQL